MRFVSGKLDDRRSLERILEGLTPGADVRRPRAVVERLADPASAYPRLAAQRVSGIVESALSWGNERRWTMLGISSGVRRVLRAVVGSGEEEALRKTRAVANVLAANEYAEFEGLA